MRETEFDISHLKIYDTSIFPKVNREQFLEENHLYFLNLSLEPYKKYIKFTEEYLENEAENLQQKHLESINENKMYYSNKEIDDETEGIPDKAGLDYAKSFLKNKAGIELRLIHKELDFFCKLKTLRNRLVHHQVTFFSDDERKINDIRALSKNRFQLMMKRDIIPTYSLYFDKPNFSLEIIQNIKSLYEKLGKNGVYY